uniref:Uncharacterized protein n=1 Tax=Oryza barthii TaxID=65489 RepID=A0A0D3FLW5_9ORYZ
MMTLPHRRAPSSRVEQAGRRLADDDDGFEEEEHHLFLFPISSIFAPLGSKVAPCLRTAPTPLRVVGPNGERCAPPSATAPTTAPPCRAGRPPSAAAPRGRNGRPVSPSPIAVDPHLTFSRRAHSLAGRRLWSLLPLLPLLPRRWPPSLSSSPASPYQLHPTHQPACEKTKERKRERRGRKEGDDVVS